jgi:hypothetical protein
LSFRSRKAGEESAFPLCEYDIAYAGVNGRHLIGEFVWRFSSKALGDRLSLDSPCQVSMISCASVNEQKKPSAKALLSQLPLMLSKWTQRAIKAQPELISTSLESGKNLRLA